MIRRHLVLIGACATISLSGGLASAQDAAFPVQDHLLIMTDLGHPLPVPRPARFTAAAAPARQAVVRPAAPVVRQPVRQVASAEPAYRPQWLLVGMGF
jgi:hypothetical protein